MNKTKKSHAGRRPRIALKKISERDNFRYNNTIPIELDQAAGLQLEIFELRFKPEFPKLVNNFYHCVHCDCVVTNSNEVGRESEYNFICQVCANSVNAPQDAEQLQQIAN